MATKLGGCGWRIEGKSQGRAMYKQFMLCNITSFMTAITGKLMPDNNNHIVRMAVIR